LREERALAGLTVAFIEDLDGLLPREALGVVDLAQVEHVALRHAAAGPSLALDDGPRAMLLAVFAPGAALQEHGGSVAAGETAG
jgi:hypothetical protein